MFQIEKNIPLRSRGPEVKYPFGDMLVGDSFVAPSEHTRIAQAAAAFAKYKGGGMKFATRKVDAGTRVWRIS